MLSFCKRIPNKQRIVGLTTPFWVYGLKGYIKHPHSKPVELQKRIISATTSKDEFVLDPAADEYSVLDACNEM